LLALLALLVSTGCTYMMAVPSTQGKAWAVKTDGFGGSTFWNCELKGDKPVCYQVNKQ
jgi:hypothetical protein